MKQLLFFILISLTLSCSKNKKEPIEQGIVALGYTSSPSFLASFPGTLESMEWLGESQQGYDISVNKLIDFAYQFEAPLGLVHVPVGEYHAVKLKFSFNNHSSWFYSVGDYNTEAPSNWFSPLLIDHEGNKLQTLTSTYDVLINLAQPIVIKKDQFNFLALNFLMDKSLLAVESAEQPAWIFSPIVEVLGADAMVWPMEIEAVTSEGVNLTRDNVSFFSPDPLWQLNSVSATGTPDAADLKGKRVLASVKLNDKGELLIPSINVLSKNLYLGQIIPHPEGAALMGHEFSHEGMQFIKSLVLPFSSTSGEEQVNNEYFVPGQQVELFYDTVNTSIQKVLFHPSEVIGQLIDVDGSWRINPITINELDAISFYLEDFAFDNSDAKFSAGDLVKVSGQFHKEGEKVRLEVLETQKLQANTSTENAKVRLKLAFSDEQMVTLNDALKDLDSQGLRLANLGASVSRYLMSEDTQVIIDAQIENVKQLDVAGYLVYTHGAQGLSSDQVAGTSELYEYLAQLPSDYAIFQMEIVGKLQEGDLVAENVVLRYRKKQNNGVDEEESPLSLEEDLFITKAESVNPLFVLAGAGGLVTLGASVFATWKLLSHFKSKKSQSALVNNQDGQVEDDADTNPKVKKLTKTKTPSPQPQITQALDEVFISSARDENENPNIEKKVTDKGKTYWVDVNGKKWDITPEPNDMGAHRHFNRDFARGLGLTGRTIPENGVIDLTEAEKNLLGTQDDSAIVREFNESLESLAGKDSKFFDDPTKLKPGEKGKLVSAAIYSIIYNKGPGNVVDLFEYDPEQKVLVEKIRATETFQNELTKDIEPKLLKIGQNAQGVKARNIAVDLEAYLKDARPTVKFSRDEITRQVKLLADFGEVKLENLLKENLYNPEEAKTLVERFKEKRTELFIDYLPEKVSAEKYKAHMKRKYLDDWLSKYHQFTPAERAVSGHHKSEMFKLFKEQGNVDTAYAAFLDENKVYALHDYYRLPQPAKDYVDSKITQWVNSDGVSIEELPPKSFKKYISQNQTILGKTKVADYFTKKYGDDFKQKLWTLTKQDLESYNLAGEILEKPTYTSREDFLKKMGAKYATHPELLTKLTKTELAAANQYKIPKDQLTVEVNKTIKTFDLSGDSPNSPRYSAFIYSNVPPGNAFEFGLSAKGGDDNISSLADLDNFDQAQGKSSFAYLKLDRRALPASEQNGKGVYRYLVDISDAEAFSKSKQNISGRLFQIDDVIAARYIDPAKIISAKSLEPTRLNATSSYLNPNYSQRKKTK